MDQPVVGVSAQAFVAVAAAYADRVHDDVRRLGREHVDAVEVVTTSALTVLDRLRAAPGRVEDLVGAWFREARVQADRVPDLDGDGDPSGAGGAVPAAPDAIVQQSEEDAAARQALAGLSERDRVALLLRDSYDLPYPSVAVALLVDRAVAPAVVAAARLRFAAELTGTPPPGLADLADHTAELAALGRSVEGPLPPEEQRALAAHLAGCTACAAAAPPLRDARTRLRGLAVVAMPDAARDEFLDRVRAAAARLLPDEAQLDARRAAIAAAGDRPPWRLSPLLVAGCLAAAVLLGGVVGIATTGGPARGSGGLPDVPPLSLSPTPSASPTPTPTPTPSRPSPRPSPAPTSPSPSPSPTRSPSRPPVTGSPTLALRPDRGRDCTAVTVSGRHWRPSVGVTITYRDITGTTPLGPTAQVAPRADGSFSTVLYACDPARIPGPHVVHATNGGTTRQATFTATGAAPA